MNCRSKDLKQLRRGQNQFFFKLVVGEAGAAVQKELIALGERQIPVVTSLLGQGTIANHHPLFLGMGGMHGSGGHISGDRQIPLISVGCQHLMTV